MAVKWTTTIAVASTTFCLSGSACAAQKIVVGERTVVAVAPSGWALVEPHLAVNPQYPNRLLGIAILTPGQGSYQEKGTRQVCRAFRSTDSGLTWQPHDFAVRWCYDPWIAYAPRGKVVIAMSGRHPAVDSIGRGQDLLLFHSADGDREWPDHPLVLRRSPDHPTIAVDTTTSKWQGSVYVMSGQSIQVATSRDGGRSFAPPARVTPNNLINLAETSVVLSNGTLVLSFVDAAWRRPDSAEPFGYFTHRRSWIVRSSDGGATFSTPLFITDACGQPPHFQQSFLTVDPSAAFRDRLYFACRRAGGGPIVVAHSSDAGAEWSEPIPVSAEPDDSTESRVVVMAVNSTGVLGVAWMVGRPAVPCHELWFTASMDGGRSFLPPERLSVPACPSAVWSTSGDYFGLASSSTGQFHLLWGEPGEAGGILVHTTVDVRKLAPASVPRLER